MTLSEDYTFQLDSGVILNATSGIPFVDIEAVKGMDNAPYRETIRDHEGQDGGFLDAEFERGRDLALTGTVFADVELIEAYMDDLKENYAPRTAVVPFVFKPPGLAERVLFVKPRGCRYDWDTARRTGETPIQFLMFAEDPRIYDNLLQNVVVNNGGLASTGFGFNFGFNLSFGVTVPPTGAIVTVGGNRPTPPTFTISGPLVDPRIINITDSKSLNFSITLGALDTLVIDTQYKTVTLNGVENRRDALQTLDWFYLNPGDTEIRLGGGSGAGTLTVSYRNAWR